MATYYVSKDGNNANNGLGPDASHATNKPWLTFGKALSTLTSGDVAYIAPGVYREVNTLSATWASETIFRGDPRNVQGFRNGSGVRVPPGAVRITGYTTNDTTAGSASAVLTTNGKSYGSFEDLYFHPYQGVKAIDADDGASTNLRFTRCYLQAVSGAGIYLRANYGVVSNFTLENCIVCSGGSGQAFRFSTVTGTGSDWDANVILRNNVLISQSFTTVHIRKADASPNLGGGVDVTGCFVLGANPIYTEHISTTYKLVLRNSHIIGSSQALLAGAVNQIDTDYNYILGVSADGNVTRGANDQELNWSGALNLFGSGKLFGLYGGQPPFALWSDSPLIGAGTGSETLDLFGKTRPNPISMGAVEYYTPPTRGFSS